MPNGMCLDMTDLFVTFGKCDERDQKVGDHNTGGIVFQENHRDAYNSCVFQRTLQYNLASIISFVSPFGPSRTSISQRWRKGDLECK